MKRWRRIADIGAYPLALTAMGGVAAATVCWTGLFHPTMDTIFVWYKSLRLVDNREFIYEGQSICRGLALGPLVHLMTAIPLAFSRNIKWQYYFLALLTFCSAPWVYAACRRLGKSNAAAATVACFYLMFCWWHNIELVVDNSRFLFFFLAVYFYFLARAAEGSPVFTLLTWFAVGLCMQTNFSAGLLIPVSVGFLWPWPIRGRTAAAHVGGILLVLAMHFHLAAGFRGFSLTAPAPEEAVFFDSSAFYPLRYFGGYGRWLAASLLLWAAMPIFQFPLPAGLVLIAAGVNRQEVGRLLWRSRTGRAALAHFVAALLLFSPLMLIKGDLVKPYYLNSISVFWCTLSVEAIDAVFAASRRLKIAVISVAAALQMALILIVSVNAAQRYAPPNTMFDSLDNRLAVAEQLATAIGENNLSNVAVLEQLCRACGDTIGNPNSPVWEVLLRYRRPSLAPRLNAKSDEVLLVYVVPEERNAGCPNAGDRDGPPVSARTISHFETGGMSVRFIATDRPTLRRQPVCVW